MTVPPDVDELARRCRPRAVRRVLARAVAACALVLVLGVVDAPGAAADGARPSNFESVIDGIDPDDTGVEVEVVGGDAFLQVTAPAGTQVIIPGYDGEPYLRIDADGTVHRNQNSAATYLNEDRMGTSARFPDRVGADAEPDWRQIGDDGRVAWHDHRIHWMLADAPDTGDGGVVQEWAVPLRVDDTEVEVTGRLLVRDDQFPWPALLAGAVGVAAAVLGRRTVLRPPLLVAASAIALVLSFAWTGLNPPDAGASPLPTILAALALALAVASRFVAGGAGALVLPVASIAALAGWFVQRVGVLWMPTLPTPLVPWLDRALTAAVIGTAVGVAVAIVVWPSPRTVVKEGSVSSPP